MAEHNTQLSTTHGCSKNPQMKKIMGKEKHMQAGLQAVFKNRRACVAEAARIHSTQKLQHFPPLHSCGAIQRSDWFILKEETHLVLQKDNVTIILLLIPGFVVVLKHVSEQI